GEVMKTNVKTKSVPKASAEKRSYLSQTDVPGSSLENALRVPRAISEHYAGDPVTPLQLAAALEMSPNAGPFRMLCGTSIAYGLTDGGSNAQQISLQSLGKRIVKPLEEGDDALAKREAILKPRVVGEFLTKYSGSPLPRHDIALNVLQEMGVPKDKAESVFSLIVDGAQTVGLLREIKGKQYVDLTGVPRVPANIPESQVELEASDDIQSEDESLVSPPKPNTALLQSPLQLTRRVFITHGKDKSFLDPIKKLLGFGEMIPIVSVEKQSVSKPVPDKVMEDMRSCSAAIIHVDAEQTLIDKDAKEHKIVNPNVLIEIGAAMALYGRRFILLVRDGVDLPSNLQGLYEVRYKGDALDGEATIKLLEAINDIKNHPLPERYKADA
ncbi:MAG: TIR domain-containing protein, partial [Fimbriimonadaceae bacterium]